MISIKRYTREDEAALFALMKNEGADWEVYWGAESCARYQAALESCLVYVAYEDDFLCGYCRCRDDNGFGIYVYDLLVDKHRRGKQIGRRLMAEVSPALPQDTVYVLSGVHGYSERQGFRREGSIFAVRL